VRLHVDMLSVEEASSAVDGQLFGIVDPFAPAIVAFAGVSLGVLVGENGAGCLHDGRAAMVFRGDEHDVLGLPLLLTMGDGIGFRV